MYEYRCNHCSARFELIRQVADREVAVVCPECESRTTMPLISQIAARASIGDDVESAPAMPAASGGGCCGGGGCAC